MPSIPGRREPERERERGRERIVVAPPSALSVRRAGGCPLRHLKSPRLPGRCGAPQDHEVGGHPVRYRSYDPRLSSLSV